MKFLCVMIPVLLLGAAGCGSDTKPATDSSTSSATDSSTSSATDLRPSDTGTAADQPKGPSVTVVYQGSSQVVSVGKPTPVTINNQSYARLSAVAQLGLPAGKSVDALLFDFESSDGFRPANAGSGYCKPIIPINAADLAKGYVQLQSRNLRWDDSQGYPGCMGVKDLAKILVSDK
jgi:hypothetical protein